MYLEIVIAAAFGVISATSTTTNLDPVDETCSSVCSTALAAAGEPEQSTTGSCGDTCTGGSCSVSGNDESAQVEDASAMGYTSISVSYSSETKITRLEDSIEPLIEHFNDNIGKPRFVALLSSTCGHCIAGANAIQESILDAYPDDDFSVSLVWIDMLRSDDTESVSQSAATYTDSRIKHFYDVKQLAGAATGNALLIENAGLAWDIYLFFDANAKWNKYEHPTPTEWTHQLSGTRRANPEFFRTGDALIQQLRESAERVLHQEN